MRNKKPYREQVTAPVNERLSPQERTDASIQLSELVTRVSTYVICYTLVAQKELLDDERISIAHAILQRVTSTHICNHKLTSEGLVLRYKDETFELHEEYKTMTLTRTVYEHLAMFYFLFERPKTDEERATVWKEWKSEGCLVETVKNDDGKYVTHKLPYSQAWKYLFQDKELSALYRHLSMHCHPVYSGLTQYQSQSESDQGGDAISLYLSTCFVAYLCRLYLKLLPQGSEVLKEEFSQREQYLFNALSRLTCT